MYEVAGAIDQYRQVSSQHSPTESRSLWLKQAISLGPNPTDTPGARALFIVQVARVSQAVAAHFAASAILRYTNIHVQDYVMRFCVYDVGLLARQRSAACRAAVCALIRALRFALRAHLAARDVAALVGRALWSTRGSDEWGEEPR